MDARWSLRDARNRLGAIVEAALKGTPQTITKRGKDAVIVLAAAEYDRFRSQRAAGTPSFISHLLSMPKDDGTK